MQLPMIHYAEDIGWRLVPQTEALRGRGGETRLVFAQTLIDKIIIIKLNRESGLNGTRAAEVIRRLQSLRSVRRNWVVTSRSGKQKPP